uniref:Protein translocase subunit SecA n=1 Tax=Cryptomonas sp. CCAC 1634B TaxID=2051848 RepID=A0A679CAG6_9CRYP|nr:preprotein-translocase subunit A [Cryptomonas sp. CCAC 1634B]
MFHTLFGDPGEKKFREYLKCIKDINRLEMGLKLLTDDELQTRTGVFARRLADGEDSQGILVEAFAVVREASWRVLGIRQFDVQLVGGIVLHSGKIAEMRTGEGKTLVAVLPAYVNALIGKGVHVVTVNDYLACRDMEYVGQVYTFLGLSLGLVQHGMTHFERRTNYSKDITYITNSELGFDYLKDNMAVQVQDIVQRPFYYCILDEVDSILIDEARTPLIISGNEDTPNEKYFIANNLVQFLFRHEHYEVDEKTKSIILTDEGTLEVEKYLGITDLYETQGSWAPYVFNALKAKECYVKDVHYLVKDNEVIIVDEFTGRMMIGRRWGDGLHQAIEAKEGSPIHGETQTLASVTYQNFFLLYPRLAGMTGTAKTEELEFEKIYGLEVVCIPTHRKMIRRDLSDVVYKTQNAKWTSIATECLCFYKLGRPVLIGTTSVENSELLSSLLKKYEVPHNLLNAKPENLKREADIIAQAGRLGAITIATNMAGRGTDILLGGNASYMARSMLRILFIAAITPGNFVEDSLCNFYKFLCNRLMDVCINPLNVETYIASACERSFTKSDIVIALRAVYLSLLMKYTNVLNEDREAVLRLGGLHVIGTERHESRRIDNQLRGRSGRQGDPGSSKFVLSLEDNLLRIFGGDKISRAMDLLHLEDSTPIESSLLSKSLESAQKKVEAYHYDARKQLCEYDEVLNTQRQIVYLERRRVLEASNLREWVVQYAERTVLDYLDYYLERGNFKFQGQEELLMKVDDLLGLHHPIDRNIFSKLSVDEMRKTLSNYTRFSYNLKENHIELIASGLMRELERCFLLQNIDSAWKEHLQQIAILKETIGWRGYAQKDPLIEYKHEAYNLFVSMVTVIRHSVVYLIFKSQPILNSKPFS